MYLAAGVMFVGGAVIVAVGPRARDDRLPLRGHAGIRTRATTHSEDTWYPAQRAAAPWMVAAGVFLVAAAVAVVLLRPADEDGLVVAAVGALGAGVSALVAALAASRTAHRILEEGTAPTPGGRDPGVGPGAPG